MVTDNTKGLLLAISSSIFIGSSFIIKKKGLMNAGNNGVRAGEISRFPDFPTLWGLCLFLL